ncbi:MAG TPA: glycine cleavage system protein H [Terriglobia bacterium]|nr:glycine cleavage system protein H [Terriglobia bacterium]
MVAIFVAFMFVSLVLTDLAVEKWQAWRLAHPARATSRITEAIAYGFEALCRVPEGVHLSSQHTWVKPDPTGGLEIGADALIVRAVGAVRRIILPKVGDEVTAGQPLFRLEHKGCAVTIPSAMTGRVMAVNSRLAEEPELLSSDPYGSGWICYLNPTLLEQSAPSVRFGERASIWLQSEFARFQEFISAQVSPDLALGVTSQDGGLPAMGCLVELGPAAWSDFEAKFLHQA